MMRSQRSQCRAIAIQKRYRNWSTDRLVRPPEINHVSIRVLNLEAAQVVAVVVQRLEERDAPRSEFRRERIRIRHIDVGIPPRDSVPDVARVVGYRRDVDSLEHEHRPAALDDAEEDVGGLRPLERDLEAQAIA